MSSYKVIKTPGDSAKFVHDRFGMFIHFGLYAIPARHEWIKYFEGIPDEKYDKYMEYFNPDLFDAKEWAKRAKDAGMKYVVLTTKHHEGFCLFDSKYTDYKVTNTPFKRDIVKEFVEAVRTEGLGVGLYYSLLDWHHPDYTIDWYHPRKLDPDAKEKNEGRNLANYVDYMHKQVEELMTNYGKIDILWFDFSYPEKNTTMLGYQDWMEGKGKEEWRAEELIKMIRKHQPHILINNRTGIDQDIWTPEQALPVEWPRHKQTGELLLWEGCQTFSGSWGYYRDESTWKSPEMLINLLISSVSYGGNMIMNVGPTARGDFDYRAKDALDVYGEWLKYHGRSIYGCTMAEPEFAAPHGCRLTQSNDGKKLYIHLIEYPFNVLIVPGLGGKAEFVQFLHDGSELLFKKDKVQHVGNDLSSFKDALVINLPVTKPNVTIPVVEVTLK